MQLTALSPSGCAPLSSQHSFRYLAETFSLCLPFSKTCFMQGAPSAVALQSPHSLPLFLVALSISFSLPTQQLASSLSLFLLPAPPSACLSHSAPLYSNFLLQSQLAIEDTMTHVLHPRRVCAFETDRKGVGHAAPGIQAEVG